VNYPNSEILKKSLPELPWEKRLRYAEGGYGLSDDDIEIYVSRDNWATFFENAKELLFSDAEKVKLVSNMMISEIPVLAGDVGVEDNTFFGNISPKNVADLSNMKVSNELSSRGVKEVLKILYVNGGDVKIVAEQNNLIQKSDTGELLEIAKALIAENPKAVEEYKGGKEQSIMFLVGQGMKVTKGSANPEILKNLFVDLLK